MNKQKSTLFLVIFLTLTLLLQSCVGVNNPQNAPDNTSSYSGNPTEPDSTSSYGRDPTEPDSTSSYGGDPTEPDSTSSYDGDPTEPDSTSPDYGDLIESYCYVICVESDSFIVSINGVGDVLIKYASAKGLVDLFDTVIIEYYKNDLIEKNGTYISVAGTKESYSYEIAEYLSIRVADPSKGDLVFG